VEDFILDGRHRAYPVVAEGRLVGLVRLDRVKAVPREEWPRRAVRDVMRPREELTVVSPGESMTRVLEEIGEAEGGRILVASGDRVEGILSRSDLARWIERTELLERA
jgi:CBS domain-containing protein